jgi:tetratricopeptide (TPR) repeat protein
MAQIAEQRHVDDDDDDDGNVTVICCLKNNDLIEREMKNDSILFYNDIVKCLEFIKTIHYGNILLFLSDEKILFDLSLIQNLSSIHIKNDNECEQSVEEIPKFIQRNIRSVTRRKQQTRLTFNFFTENQQSLRFITKDFASFLWFQILLDLLIKMPNKSQSKEYMLGRCRKHYHKNITQLEKINLFEQTYKSTDAIRWYTNESFLYRLVNRALRTEDTDDFYTYRFYISDLCTQLSDEHYKQQLYNKKIKLYRGQTMSDEEIIKLRDNIGNLISPNGFFSTSTDFNVAKIFTSQGNNGVLFEIEADSNLKYCIFANIELFSQIPDEKEVLFSIGAVFKINNVYFDEEINLWKINLQATDEGREHIDQYIEYQKKQLEETSVNIIFGDILIDIGQYSKSEMYFKSLLETLPIDHEDRIACYQHVARAQHFQGKLNEALDSYQQVYGMQHEKCDNLNKTDYLFCLGAVNTDFGRYQDAMNFFQDALKMTKKNLFPINDHSELAHILNGIGWVYGKQGEYNNALSFRIQALEMRKRLLPSDHPHIAGSFGSLSDIYCNKGQYEKAIDFGLKALQLREQILPKGHIVLSHSQMDIGNVYYAQGLYDLSFECYTLSLEIRRKNLLENHPLIAHSLDAIGCVYRCKKDYINSFDYHTRALTMLHKSFKNNQHPLIANCLHRLGNVHEDQDHIDEAFNLYLEALEIKQKLLSDKHPSLLRTLTCLSNILCLRGQYDQALKSYINIFEKQQNQFEETHPDMGITLYRMGICYYRKQQFDEAKQHYNQALIIQRRWLPHDHNDIDRTIKALEEVDSL